MNLTSKDYKQLISNRVQTIYLETSDNGLALGNYPDNREPTPERVPNFDLLRSALAEIGELLEDYETSLGPA